MLNRFIDQIKDQIEITYYSDQATETTYHIPDASRAEPGSWTHEFAQRGLIAAPKAGGKYREFERTMAALYCLYLTMEGHYEEFVAIQKNGREQILQPESFAQLRQQVLAIVDTKEKLAMLNSLIVKSDLGKTPRVKQLARAAGITAAMDSDDLLVEIFKLSDAEITTILPSYAQHMLDGTREMLKEIYPIMTACFGHIYFLENGQATFRIIAKALEKIPKEKREQALNLVFLAQFYDGVGSQGQLSMHGSVTCNEDFYRGYMIMFTMLKELNTLMLDDVPLESAVETVFQQYLYTRGSMLGITDLPEKKFQTLVRIGCMVRGFTPEFGRVLLSEFAKLSAAEQELVIDQFNFKQEGFNLLPMPAHYVATAPQNISTALFGQGKQQEAIAAAIKSMVCFAYIFKAMNQQFPAVNLRTKVSFGELAFYADKFKGLFNEPEKLAQVFQFSPSRNKIMPLLPRPHKVGKIKNLIFDLGKVFIDIDIERKPVFAAFAALSGLTAAEVEQVFDANRQISDEYHRGKKTSDEFRNELSAALGIQYVHSHEAQGAAQNSLGIQYVHGHETQEVKQNVPQISLDNRLGKQITEQQFFAAWTASILGKAEIVKERLTYLAGLKKLGYKIFLLSNNNDIHCEHTRLNYESEKWEQYFDAQYYSNRTGRYKPDAESFDQVIQEQQLDPTETMFFDDMPVNVEAARKYGIHAVVFTVDNAMQEIEQLVATVSMMDTLQRGTYKPGSINDKLLLWKQRAHANAQFVAPEVAAEAPKRKLS